MPEVPGDVADAGRLVIQMPDWKRRIMRCEVAERITAVA
jgi:hypothetical protein